METATPTTLPNESTTGPPEFPGCMPPLTCTLVKAPLSSFRKLETEDVLTVISFPFGSNIGKEITVSTSSVSSLRKEESGALTKVQVNGGMHPGNSGGPVVDSFGNVVGVAVSILRGTQINFAVPGDYVRSIFHGRIAG